MWWGLLALILAVSGVVMFRRGPVAALGCGVLISFLFPCWITLNFMGVPIDLRVATALVLLSVNLFHPQARISWSFSACDWAIFTLYVISVASDTWQDGFSLSSIPRTFGEWSVPYLAGRLAIQNVQDWRWLTNVAVVIATIFAVWTATEAFTRVNIANPVFGARPADQTDPMQIRVGIKRAEGPTRHAIWFAMLQTLLLPWTITAAYRALHGDGPIWWIVTPLLSFFGVLLTVARGAALAAAAAFYLTAVFSLPKFRTYLIVAGIGIVIAGFFAKNYLMNSLDEVEYRNLSSDPKLANNLEFRGQQHRLTSMSYRWIILKAYLPSMTQAGFLGFGTERTSTFPVNVPMGPEAQKTISVFWSIDCEYLLLILRFGWCGVAAFLAVCVTSSGRILQQSTLVLPNERILPLAIAATLIASTFALLVEWMPHDYGFMFLWLCGVANGTRLTRPTGKRHSFESKKRDAQVPAW